MTSAATTDTRIAAVADVLGIGATAVAIVRAATTDTRDPAAAGARVLEPLYDQLTRTSRRILRDKVQEALAEAEASAMT